MKKLLALLTVQGESIKFLPTAQFIDLYVDLFLVSRNLPQKNYPDIHACKKHMITKKKTTNKLRRY